MLGEIMVQMHSMYYDKKKSFIWMLMLLFYSQWQVLLKDFFTFFFFFKSLKIIKTTPTSMKIEAKVYVPEDQTDPLAASAMNLDVTFCILGFGFGFKSLDISDIQWHTSQLHWIMTETKL